MLPKQVRDADEPAAAELSRELHNMRRSLTWILAVVALMTLALVVSGVAYIDSMSNRITKLEDASITRREMEDKIEVEVSRADARFERIVDNIAELRGITKTMDDHFRAIERTVRETLLGKAAPDYGRPLPDFGRPDGGP